MPIAQRVLAQITHLQGCGLGPSEHNLVLVNRADLFNCLRDRFGRRAAAHVAPALRDVLDESPDAAADALSSYLQLETTVRAAGATARACTLWQNGVGFLSTDQEGHARATVALTRALTATFIFSPPDMGGLVGLAQTLAAWETGVWLVGATPAPTFHPVSEKRLMERISFDRTIPWASVPLAIAEEHCPRSTERALRLVAVRAPAAWRLRRQAPWAQYRYLLPEAPSNRDPLMI
jgi:hypothetical protein